MRHAVLWYAPAPCSVPLARAIEQALARAGLSRCDLEQVGTQKPARDAGGDLDRPAILGGDAHVLAPQPVGDRLLLDVDLGGERTLAAGNLDRTLKSLTRIHGANTTSPLVTLSTSKLVATTDKGFCKVASMGSFAERMQEAVRRAGGQAALARRVKERFGQAAGKVSAQTIQYLQSQSRGKTARRSGLTAQIAAVTGLSAQWLASGEGAMDAGALAGQVPRAEVAVVRVRETGEIFAVELTKDALHVARLFMDLPGNEREEVKRSLELKSLPYRRPVPDAALEHLRAPTAKGRKRAKGTQ